MSENTWEEDWAWGNAPYAEGGLRKSVLHPLSMSAPDETRWGAYDMDELESDEEGYGCPTQKYLDTAPHFNRVRRAGRQAYLLIEQYKFYSTILSPQMSFHHMLPGSLAQIKAVKGKVNLHPDDITTWLSDVDSYDSKGELRGGIIRKIEEFSVAYMAKKHNADLGDVETALVKEQMITRLNQSHLVKERGWSVVG